MNIMVAFNDGYTLPTKVMLKSLIINNQEHLDIYVIYTSLSDDSINSVLELEDGEKVSIHLLPIKDSFIEGVPLSGHFSKESYIRLFAQSVLDTSIDRILWLDGDIIINQSLSNYYYQDFGGKVFIATEDMYLGNDIERHKKLGMPLDSPYINAGVLLINLELAREVIDDDTVHDYIKQNFELLDFADQDVLNGLYYMRFKIVDPAHKYNFFSLEITENNKKHTYKTVHIFHYVGKVKPWKKGYRYGGFNLWWKYAFLCGNEYRELYRKNFLSNIKGMAEHSIAMIIRNRFPSLFDYLLRFYSQ